MTGEPRPAEGMLRRGRWGLAAALAFVVAGCALSTSIRISPHRVVHLRRTVLSTFDLDQLLGEMLQPELIRFLESQPQEFRNEPRVLAALGRAQSAARLYDDARRTLAEAREAFGTGSGRAGEAGWIESQTAFQQGDAPAALAAARAADEHMFRVPEGWMKYLEELSRRAPRFNRIEGTGVRIFFRYGNPRLPRIRVRIEGHEVDAVVDTGAALTLVSEKAAATLGIVPFPGCEAEGSGIHGSRFPVRFGLARSLEIGGLRVADLPVGVIPDSAVEFESGGKTTRYDILLGTHLWKEFRVVLNYPNRILDLRRTDPPTRDDLARANLFVVDGKPLVRGSLNGLGWFRYLLDTGSEFTLLHRTGAKHAASFLVAAPVEPVTVHGIGQSRSTWGKVSDITLGADAWQIRFDDLLFTDDAETLDDAILGSTFLENFIVTIDFGHLRFVLERPEEFDEELMASPAIKKRD